MTGDPPDRLDRDDRLDPSDRLDRGHRTVLKFDAGRRGFGRAMVALAVAAVVLLGFGLLFLWPVLSRSLG